MVVNSSARHDRDTNGWSWSSSHLKAVLISIDQTRPHSVVLSCVCVPLYFRFVALPHGAPPPLSSVLNRFLSGPAVATCRLFALCFAMSGLRACFRIFTKILSRPYSLAASHKHTPDYSLSRNNTCKNTNRTTTAGHHQQRQRHV